jgi:hypothetical protein
VLLDELPGGGHIDFEQGVDAVLPLIQAEVVVSVAACGWDLYDAKGRGDFRHPDSSPHSRWFGRSPR